MTPRERVLAVIRKRLPDRVPKSMDFNEAARRRVGDPARHFNLDLQGVSFKPTKNDAGFADYLARLPADAEIGSRDILLSYSEWGYQPGTPEMNPLRATATEEQLTAYRFPDIAADYRYSGLEDRVRTLGRKGLATVGYPPKLGGLIFEAAWRMLGFGRFLEELYYDRPLTVSLMDRLTEYGAYNAAVLARAGVDLIYLADDVGCPTGLLLSPDLWRRAIKPRLRRIILSAKKAAPDVAIVYHSDGDVTAIVPDLVEIGIEVLNPVQPDRMDPGALKRLFGDQLCFWGGVGDHRLMSFGKPEAIEHEVRRRIETLGDGGGFIAAPAYDTHSDVPWANIVAFSEAVDRYGLRTGGGPDRMP